MQESGQNYLETIYLLNRETKRVRSVDVARALGFSKPSVCRAMGKLKEEGYLEDTDSLDLVLTKKGKDLALKLVDRQETIAQFFMMTTGVEEEIATKDAKKMMHFLSDAAFEGMKEFIAQVESMHA